MKVSWDDCSQYNGNKCSTPPTSYLEGIYGYGLEMKISKRAFKGQLDHAARIGFLLGETHGF
jgi:hypothetical protein